MYKYDSQVQNAVNELENISQLLKGGKNISKATFKHHIKSLNHKIDKILTSHLFENVQNALGKHIDKAFQILKHLT